MVKARTFWMVGGDERQAVLAGLLAADGHRVHVCGMEERLHCEPGLDGIGEAHCVILPLPVLEPDGRLHTPLSQKTFVPAAVLNRLRPGQAVLAGKIPPALYRMAGERGLALEDYFAREELAVLNAIPTAEGTIQLAMELLPVTLHGARVLLFGFGRLGQALGPRLRSLGALVSVAARRAEQRAWAQSMGLDSQRPEGLKEWLGAYDLVINTAPAQVLGVEELAALKEGTPVIDLASLPGGVDDESAAALGVRVVHALSLPGKAAPVTAARYLRDTVYHILEG